MAAESLPEGRLVRHRYRVLRPLGEGGMAFSYLVEDLLFGGRHTLKALRHGSGELHRALRNEFALLRGLYHPHLVQVLDFGLERADGREGWPYYVARHVAGESLGTFVQAGRTWSEVRAPIVDGLHALAFLHGLGLRHGDVTPSNLIVTPEGRGVLIDLGCARPFEHHSDTVCGTPGFLAPEVLSGRAADQRADLYSLGVLLASLEEVGLDGMPPSVTHLSTRLKAARPLDRPSSAHEVLELLGEAAVPPGAPGGRCPRLVGRAEERRLWARMLDALSEGPAEGGPGRVLWVCGPDGIGRSRLLEELKWAAQLRSSVVEGSPDVPMPVTSLLSRAAGVSLAPGVAGVLEARDAILQLPEPVVLVMDDVHRLPPDAADAWLSFLSSIDPSDPLIVLCAGRTPPARRGRAVSVQELGPLSRAEVAEWASDLVLTDQLEQLHRLTGGFPAYVERLLLRAESGELRPGDLAGSGSGVSLDVAALGGLGRDSLRCLGVFAVVGGQVPDTDPVRSELPDAELASLVGQGFLERYAAGFRLRRLLDGPVVLRLLGEEAKDLHRKAALRCSRGAEMAYHLALAGDTDAALSHLRENEARFEDDPRGFRRVAMVLEGNAGELSAEDLLILSRAHLVAGEPRDALSPLARLLRRRPGTDVLHACQREVGACCLRMGDGTRAARYLRAALESATDGPARAAVSDLLARALIQRGDYAEVRAVAGQALEEELDDSLRARLSESLGVAFTYLGEQEQAARYLGAALEAMGGHATPRALVRVQSYRGIAAFRRGDIRGAIAWYRRAIEVAEREGLSDLYATAALNLATAYQAHGDFGLALEAYGRASRLARALGKVSTEATLELNLSNLYATIGAADRAEAALSKAREGARRHRLGHLDGTLATLRGDVAVLRRELEEARGAYLEAQAIFQGQGATREMLEMDLLLCSVDLESGDVERCAERLRSRGPQLFAAGDGEAAQVPADLRARASLMRAEMSLASARGPEALSLLEDARRLAEASGQPLLCGETDALFVRAFVLQGDERLADVYRDKARHHWARIAATLPTSLRPVFWAHPRRRALGLDQQLGQDASPLGGARGTASGDAHPGEGTHAAPRRRLHRVLAINRRLNSLLSVDDLLGFAIDAAIELTGAERGFVLIAEPEISNGAHRPESTEPDVRVVTARNLDRERIGRSHLKFSRGIAEEVVSSGHPVVTTDARGDSRFAGNQSVHAMRLVSVACVPIASPQGVLGALYLDNRFHQGRFGAADVELLLAFADQVAIALRNARLHAELLRRTEELLVEKARVEQLMQGQAQEIERLSREVRAKQEVLELRYDYSAIVGDSPPMRELFATLDRVIDSPLSVLVSGESGTGKELVAKAIHFNGPRRDRPYVTVNCAALPDALLESELFGYVRGAFTGADRDHRGLMATAEGGTLFLDEVGEMPLGMQAKILRVLESREVRPLGSTSVVPIDIRVVSATNRRLRDEIIAGGFREDLFYRIAGVEVELPPLRERLEDLPALCQMILSRLARKGEGRRTDPEGARSRGAPQLADAAGPKKLLPGVLSRMMAYEWPGNVRELENVLGRAVVMAPGSQISNEHIALPERARTASAVLSREEFEVQERRRIAASLATHRWNVSAVSRDLGIPRNTLYRRLERYRLARPAG